MRAKEARRKAAKTTRGIHHWMTCASWERSATAKQMANVYTTAHVTARDGNELVLSLRLVCARPAT
jgi:hypothetical protein